MKNRFIIASSFIGIAVAVYQFGYFPFTHSETTVEPTIKPIASWVTNGVLRDGKEIDSTKLLVVDPPKRLVSQSFALEAWFRYADNKDYRWVIGSAVPAVRWGIEVLRDHHRLGYVLNTAQGPLLVNSKIILRPNTWYAVLWQWNGTTLQTFINGKKDVEKDLTSSQIAEYPAKWYIGAGIWSKVQPMKGSIDEVLLFDRVFSADEIKKRYEDPPADKTVVNKPSEVKQPENNVSPDTNKKSSSATTPSEAESIFGKVESKPQTSEEIAAQPLSIGIHASRQEIVSGSSIAISWLISRKSPTPITCKIRETVGEKLISEFDTPYAEGTRDFRPVIDEEKATYNYTYRCPSPIADAVVNVTVNPGAIPELQVDIDRVDLGSVSQNSTPIAKEIKISSVCPSGQCSPLNWIAATEAPFRLSETSGSNEAFIKVSGDTSTIGTFEKTATIRFHDQIKTVRLLMKVEARKPTVTVLKLFAQGSGSTPTVVASNYPHTIQAGASFRMIAKVTQSDGKVHQSDAVGESVFRWQVLSGGAGLVIDASTGEIKTSIDPDHAQDASKLYVIQVQYLGVDPAYTEVQQVKVQYPVVPTVVLTLTRSATQPTGLLGGSNMDLLKFDLTATGDTITVKDIEFVYAQNCSNIFATGPATLQSADKSVTYATWAAGTAWFGNASNSAANSIKVLGTENATERGAGGFDVTLTIAAGETKHLVFSGDTSGCTMTDQSFQVSIDAGKRGSRSTNTTLSSGILWQDSKMTTAVDSTTTKTLPVTGPLFQK